MTAARFWRLVNRTAVGVLVLAVLALSTLAKTSSYLPQRNPGHSLTEIVKIKTTDSQLSLNPELLQPIAKVTPLLPEAQRISYQFPVEMSVLSIALTISPQHRAPPPSVT